MATHLLQLVCVCAVMLQDVFIQNTSATGCVNIVPPIYLATTEVPGLPTHRPFGSLQQEYWPAVDSDANQISQVILQYKRSRARHDPPAMISSLLQAPQVVSPTSHSIQEIRTHHHNVIQGQLQQQYGTQASKDDLPPGNRNMVTPSSALLYR